MSILFNNKCGYCECDPSRGGRFQIDHFRPKKEIASEMNKKGFPPGYYWLGMYWDNLILSCEYCNIRDTHEGYKKATGKGTYFPISDENKRHKNPNNKSEFQKEEKVRLLIDPCKDDPSKDLDFIVDDLDINKIGLVTWKTEKGKTSVTAFGLNRFRGNSGLRIVRKNLVMEITSKINEYIEEINIAIKKNDSDSIDRFTRKLKNEIDKLRKDVYERKVEFIAFRMSLLKAKKDELKKYGIIINI